MNPTKFEQELALNRQAYEALREPIRRDYAGQYVAIAFGKIVAVCPTFAEAKAAVERLHPAPDHVLVFSGAEDPAFEVYDALHTEWF